LVVGQSRKLTHLLRGLPVLLYPFGIIWGAVSAIREVWIMLGSSGSRSAGQPRALETGSNSLTTANRRRRFMETILSVSQARRELPTLSRMAKERLQRYVLTNRGRAVAVLMSFGEYKALTAARDLVTRPDVLADTLRGVRQLRRDQGVELSKLSRKIGRRRYSDC
jgi:PHD/YefM family antitoxin component YafN of YafNO toxin-antitoxin module